MLPIAYLPQHLAEVSGLAVSVCGIAFALPPLIRGESPELERWSPGRIRVVAAAAVLVAVAIGVSGFVLPAEPPGGLPGGHWGTTFDKALLGVWLIGIASIAVFVYRRNRSRRS